MTPEREALAWLVRENGHPADCPRVRHAFSPEGKELVGTCECGHDRVLAGLEDRAAVSDHYAAFPPAVRPAKEGRP